MVLIDMEIPKSVEIQKQLTAVNIERWLKYDVFHLKWWILIVLVLVLFYTWWILLNKSKTNEICLYVILSTFIFIGIDEYGEELVLWDYPIEIIPIFPPLTSINLIMMPLIYSLIYQYFKNTKSFLWITLIMTILICFIIEPILTWFEFYKLIHWKYYYSFPLYMLIAILVRSVTIKIINITEKHTVKNSN